MSDPIKSFARQWLQDLASAEVAEQVQAMEPEEIAEDHWEEAVLAAMKNNNAFPALELFLQGLRPPPLASEALKDVVARKAGKAKGLRPTYGRAGWTRADLEKRKRRRENKVRIDAYDRHWAILQAETGRQRKLKDEAVRRAAEELSPEHQRTEAQCIRNAIKARSQIA